MIRAMAERRKWGASPTFGPRQWFRHRLLVRELAASRAQGTVLDAGCGHGRMAELLSKRGLQVFGFDESSLAVSKAATRVPDALFWSGSLLQMALPDAKFDAVISGDVLEHLEDDKKAVAEIFRVLKPGGLAVVSVPADPKKWSLDDEWSGHKRRYNKADLISLFKSAGFAVIKCRHWGWPITWIYYRLFYIPMLKRQLGSKQGSPGLQGMKESKLYESAFRIAFLPDMLCLDAPAGIGLLAVFSKPRP